MAEGLTYTDWKVFFDLKVKANIGQLLLLRDLLNDEINRREK